MTGPSTLTPRTPQMINPQGVLTGLIVLIVVVVIGMVILSLIGLDVFASMVSAGALICFVCLLAGHLRGWRYSAQATVLAAVVFTILGNPAELTTRQLSFTVLIPSDISLV